MIEIPKRPEDPKEKVKLVNKTSKNINDLIVGYNKEYLLPRCGFSPDRNETNFKEEMVIDRMIMLDIKKSYAYRQISSEAKIDPETNELVAGNIFEHPQIEKKSGLGVKSDMIDLTKTILDYLINITLDDKIKRENKYTVALKQLYAYHEEFKDCFKNLRASRIGTPVRWQKKINAVNAMKLYNSAVEKTFQYLSTGHLLYCKFASEKVIRDLDLDITAGKINAIAIPPKFNSELIAESFKKYGISFDQERQWDNILNKTCKRLLAELKKVSEKN